MQPTSIQITIHLARIGKPPRSYTEGFVEDNGIRLVTFSVVPLEVSIKLSEKFRQYGRFQSGQSIASVSKYHFYREYFSIVAYRDKNEELLGYYCDLVTPLQKNGDEYFLTDLILDLWISPDLSFQELDRDEFEQAIQEGLITPELQQKANETMDRLGVELSARVFPASYMG